MNSVIICPLESKETLFGWNVTRGNCGINMMVNSWGFSSVYDWCLLEELTGEV